MCLYHHILPSFLCNRSEKLADAEDALRSITIPKDPAASRKTVKETLDAHQISCVKPDPATSSILTHAATIR